jgi:hypothetical protein
VKIVTRHDSPWYEHGDSDDTLVIDLVEAAWRRHSTLGPHDRCMLCLQSAPTYRLRESLLTVCANCYRAVYSDPTDRAG